MLGLRALIARMSWSEQDPPITLTLWVACSMRESEAAEVGRSMACAGVHHPGVRHPGPVHQAAPATSDMKLGARAHTHTHTVSPNGGCPGTLAAVGPVSKREQKGARATP